jgi:hypothetical protein
MLTVPIIGIGDEAAMDSGRQLNGVPDGLVVL